MASLRHTRHPWRPVTGSTGARGFAGYTRPEPLSGDLGDTSGEGFMALVQSVTEFASSETGQKMIAAAQEYGPEVAEAFGQRISSSETMRNAYTARSEAAKTAIASGTDVDREAAQEIARGVNATENQLLSTIIGKVNAGTLTDGTQVPVPTRVGYRDVEGITPAWLYREFADGSVLILEAPKPDIVNLTVRETTHPDGWSAIHAEILDLHGPYPVEAAKPPPGLSQQAEQGVRIASRMIQSEPALGPAEKALLTGALAAGTAAAAGTATTGSLVVGGLLGAAGASSAVPVAGWIVAAGLATAAGAIVTVKLVKKGKATNAQVVALAEANGIPDAAEVPGFAKRVIRMTPQRRQQVGKRLARVIKRSRLRPKRKQRLAAKLAVLAAAELLDMANKRTGVVQPLGLRNKAKSTLQRGKSAASAEGLAPPGFGEPLILAAYTKPLALPGVLGNGNIGVHPMAIHGLGGVTLGDLGGGTRVVGVVGFLPDNLEDLQPSSFAIRMRRAKDGNLTDGGVIDARESAAFVLGYVKHRYIPDRRECAKMTDAEALKVGKLAAQFSHAASATSAFEATRLAFGIPGPILETLGTRWEAAWSAIRTGDPNRADAVSVLRHASAIFTAAAHPLIAEQLIAAADTAKADELSLAGKAVEGLADAVAVVTATQQDKDDEARRRRQEAKVAEEQALVAIRAEAEAQAEADRKGREHQRKVKAAEEANRKAAEEEATEADREAAVQANAAAAQALRDQKDANRVVGAASREAENAAWDTQALRNEADIALDAAEEHQTYTDRVVAGAMNVAAAAADTAREFVSSEVEKARRIATQLAGIGAADVLATFEQLIVVARTAARAKTKTAEDIAVREGAVRVMLPLKRKLDARLVDLELNGTDVQGDLAGRLRDSLKAAIDAAGENEGLFADLARLIIEGDVSGIGDRLGQSAIDMISDSEGPVGRAVDDIVEALPENIHKDPCAMLRLPNAFFQPAELACRGKASLPAFAVTGGLALLALAALPLVLRVAGGAAGAVRRATRG